MFKTTCILAAIALCAAGAPPRISLDLSAMGTLVNDHPLTHNPSTSTRDYAEECAASNRTADGANCKFPLAKAFDYQQAEVVVTTDILLLDNDEDQSNMEVSVKGNDAETMQNPITKEAAILTRSTYMFTYSAVDDSNNEAEQVNFALVINDQTAPEFVHVPPAINVEYGETGPFADGNIRFACFDTVDGTVKHTLACDNCGEIAACGSTMNTVNAQHKCQVGGSTQEMNYAGNQDITFTATCVDSAGIYGVNGQSNSDSRSVVVTVRDTTPPVFEQYDDEAPLECERDVQLVPRQTETCRDDATAAKWAHTLIPVESNLSGVKLNVGTKDVTYTCTDNAHNVATQRRTYTVTDTTPPQIIADYTNPVTTMPDSDYNHVDSHENKWVHLIKSTSTSFGQYTNDNVIGTCSDGVCEYHDRFHQLHISRTLEVSDTCTDMSTDASKNTQFVRWNTEHGFDPKVPGDYLRTYKATDAVGNTAEVEILVQLQDADAPIIEMNECDATSSDGYCRTRIAAAFNVQYVDSGAKCDDYVDGALSSAVEVSGQVVNMRRPGTYLIKYDCQDLSGQMAQQATREVIVFDTTPPTIYHHGEQMNVVEAGFPFKDLGATLSDDLCGSCELTESNHKWSNFPTTSCTFSKTVAANGHNANQDSNDLDAFMTYLATSDPSTSDKPRAQVGDYVITYTGQDTATPPNVAQPWLRTIQVRDTLPPVITLHDSHQVLNRAANNHAYNPAERADGSYTSAQHMFQGRHTNGHSSFTFGGNPNLSLMAQAASVNGWMVAAVASAITGIALLSYSSKNTDVAVPV